MYKGATGLGISSTRVVKKDEDDLTTSPKTTKLVEIITTNKHDLEEKDAGEEESDRKEEEGGQQEQHELQHQSKHIKAEEIPKEEKDGEWKLEVLQEPVKARSCGNGTKDYRSIDPSPIVKVLKRISQDSSKEVPVIPPKYSKPKLGFGLVLVASIWSVDKDGKVLQQEKNILTGNTVSEARFLVEKEGAEGCFFIFNELSVRRDGQFRLLFTLCDIHATSRGSSQLVPHSTTKARIFSEIFYVYLAKAFPGKGKTTELTNHFAQQLDYYQHRY